MQVRLQNMTGARWWVLVAVFTAVMAMSISARASDMQRMVLAPGGCYALPPGGYSDAAAYCLDRSRQAPPEGVILSSVAAPLQNADVKISGGPALTLAEALDRHLVQIEGRGNDQQLRFRNLTDRPMEICIGGPTVVMGNGETYAGDLGKIRGQIAHLLASAQLNDARAHAATQEKLWEIAAKADQEESKAWTRDLTEPLLLPSPRALPSGKAIPPDCASAGHPAEIKVCVR